MMADDIGQQRAPVTVQHEKVVRPPRPDPIDPDIHRATTERFAPPHQTTSHILRQTPRKAQTFRDVGIGLLCFVIVAYLVIAPLAAIMFGVALFGGGGDPQPTPEYVWPQESLNLWPENWPSTCVDPALVNNSVPTDLAC